jgi:hypothetical protein
MSRVKEVDLGIGQITLEGFSSCRQEERVDVRESSWERNLTPARGLGGIHSFSMPLEFFGASAKTLS